MPSDAKKSSPQKPRNYRDCECDNCKRVAATAKIVLSYSVPAGPGISQLEVDLWNNVLAESPCLKISSNAEDE